MKKILFLSVFALACTFVFIECLNKKPAVEKKPDMKLITHKEAVDTMRADSNAPLKPLVFKKLQGMESYNFCKNNDLSCILKQLYPTNGFFGEDNYRIEILISEVKRDTFNLNIYHVKGKNRHKKIITPFEGQIRILDIANFTDPNIDAEAYKNMEIKALYALNGDFELKEDPNSKYSGIFKGKFISEISTTDSESMKDCPVSYWFYSEQLPSQGAGVRYDGTWASYAEPSKTKPVVWAEDFFRFANNILKDFSYGEREIEINPQYRNLGWQELWEEKEWWTETPKKSL